MSTVMDTLLKDIVSLDDDTRALLTNAGVKRMTNFATIPASDLTDSMGAAGMNLGDIHDVLAFQEYFCIWRAGLAKNNKQDIEKQLTPDVWDEHLTNIAMRRNSASTAGALQTNPAFMVSAPTVAKRSDTFASFKWDTKNVPVLPKNKSINKAYDSWEESFLVQMTLANVSNVLEPSWVPSSDPDEIMIKNKKMGIVKAALLHATIGTTAAPYMNAKDTGHEMLFLLCAAYRGEDALLRKAESAHNKLATLEFGPKPKLSAEQFASTFKLCLKRMEESGTPYPANVIKSTFLTKVTHPDYAHFCYNKMTNGSTFEEMLRRFHDLTLLLRASNKGKTDTNHKTVNAVNGGLGNKKSKNQNKNDKKSKNKFDDYIPKADWAKMSKKEQDAIQEKCKNENGLKQGTGNLPMQYGGHLLSNNVSGSASSFPSMEEFHSYLQAVQQLQGLPSANTPPSSLPSSATRAAQLLQSLPNWNGPSNVNQ